jgi:acetyl-CoA C-acetyltransferase
VRLLHPGKNIVTLINVLEQNNGTIGAAAICVGGDAPAIVIEKHN